MVDANLQVPGYKGVRECLGSLPDVRRNSPLCYWKCAVLDECCYQMKDLQEELLKLCIFKEIVREIGKVVSDMQHFESLRP